MRSVQTRYFSEAAPGSIHKSIYDKQTVAPPNMTEPSLFFSMANGILHNFNAK